MVWDLKKSMYMYSVTQLCLTLCSPMDYSPPGSSVNGLLQANWNGLPFSIPRDLNNPGIQPVSLHLLSWWADSLPLEPTGGKLENFQMWELKKKSLQNNQLVKKKKKVKKGNKKYLETNENGNRAYQNVWDTVKAVLRGKYTAINSYIKKKRSQVTLHLK